jgi:4-hydroxybenzoate polyprenyltransferase
MPAVLTKYWSVGFQFPLPLEYYVMICLNTAAGYWTNMLTDAREDALNYGEKDRFLAGEARWIKALVLLSITGSFILAARAGWRVVLFGLILNCLGTLYGLELRWGAWRFRVKSVPLLKNVYSSFFWSVALLLCPSIYLNTPLDVRLFAAIPCMFLLVLYVEMLWDIRDINGDRAAGVRTIPVLLGEERSRWIIHAVNVAGAASLVAMVFSGSMPPAYLTIVPNAAGCAVFTELMLRRNDRTFLSHVLLLFEATSLVVTICLGPGG